MSIFTRKPSTTPAAAPPVSAGVSLTKGASSTINLRKDAPGATVTVHLDWDGGNALRRALGADLELYALHVPANEVTSPDETTRPGHAVYWKDLGTNTARPYIRHHGDSLTPGRETVTIAHPDQQGYVLICAYSAVSNGPGSFKSFGAHAVVDIGDGNPVTVPLYENNRASYWTAIALLDFTGPQGVSVRQVETYGRSGSEARPVLYSDGSFRMDAGPVEFKR